MGPSQGLLVTSTPRKLPNFELWKCDRHPRKPQHLAEFLVVPVSGRGSLGTAVPPGLEERRTNWTRDESKANIPRKLPDPREPSRPPSNKRTLGHQTGVFETEPTPSLFKLWCPEPQSIRQGRATRYSRRECRLLATAAAGTAAETQPGSLYFLPKPTGCGACVPGPSGDTCRWPEDGIW